jgi:5-methylcytosine-specific restriction protein A
MADEKRLFRTKDSLDAERRTRGLVQVLLEQRGFTDVIDNRRNHGPAQSQVITARGPDGHRLKMHVRLCWRRDGRNAQERKYAATQLRSDLVDRDWDKTLAQIASRDIDKDITHNLLVQFDQDEFVWAALVPSDQMPAIWHRQFEVSANLIAAGLTGRMKKNHAANGSSPTLWLQDDRTAHTHAVADVLWSWPGVVDVLTLPVTGERHPPDDTYDDLPMDYSLLGRDAGTRVAQQSSGYPRDQKVRGAVLARAGGACERDGCGQARPYPGFLDVHHILRVSGSDRVWSCVALCPNCHREAHFAPDRDDINGALQAYAERFAGPRDT